MDSRSLSVESKFGVSASDLSDVQELSNNYFGRGYYTKSLLLGKKCYGNDYAPCNNSTMTVHLLNGSTTQHEINKLHDEPAIVSFRVAVDFPTDPVKQGWVLNVVMLQEMMQ